MRHHHRVVCLSQIQAAAQQSRAWWRDGIKPLSDGLALI